MNDAIRDEIMEELNREDGPVKCPVCGYGMSHVRVQPLTPEMTDTRQGGYAVWLDGECGHSWGCVYAEHKGEVVRVRFQTALVPVLREEEQNETRKADSHGKNFA